MNKDKTYNLNYCRRNTHPFFSIICPFKNGSEFLNKCASVLLKQTYKSFELIFIDDGSSDNSINTLKDYLNDDRVSVVINTTNKGPQFSRMKGVSLSKGKYILFLDCDDSLAVNALDVLFNLIKGQETEPDCILFEYTKRSISSFEYVAKIEQENKIIEGSDNIIKHLYLEQISYYCWNKCYKREVFETLGTLNDDLLALRYCEDLVLSYIFLRQCKKVLLTRADLYSYYQNPKGSCSLINRKRIEDQIVAYFYIYESIFQTMIINNNFSGFCSNLNSTVLLKIYLEFFSNKRKGFIKKIASIRRKKYIDYSLNFRTLSGFSGFLVKQFKLKRYNLLYILIYFYTVLFKKRFVYFKE